MPITYNNLVASGLIRCKDTQKVAEEQWKAEVWNHPLEAFSTNLFWDTDPSKVDMEQHAKYIVGRVLDYGSWEDWLLIRSYYGIDRLREIAMGLRSMFPESLSFIALATDTPENQFRCYELIQSKTEPWYS
jgi:hypothetical protein